MRQAVLNRWRPFLEENRPALQPLVNELLEMRLGLKPPAAQRVQAWAKRAAPVFDRFEKYAHESMDELRDLIPPLQRGRFERDALRAGVALRGAGHKLGQWAMGRSDPEELWLPPRAPRRKHKEHIEKHAPKDDSPKAALRNAEDPADQIVLELEAWDRYVADFVRLYDLDVAQRGAAASCLAELKQRALDHRDQRRQQIVELEHRISQGQGSTEALADIRKRLTELYGPVDEMFRDLQHRIERIPTSDQRARVTEENAEETRKSRRKPRRPNAD